MANTGFYTGSGTTFTISVTGLRELQQKLHQLSQIQETKACDQALKAGAVVIKESIKQSTPIGPHKVTHRDTTYYPGNLRASIIVQKTRRIKGMKYLEYKVGPDRRMAYYAHMVEFGTSRHAIKPKNKQFLKFKRTSGGQYRPEFISEQTYAQAFSAGRKVSGGYVFMKEVDVAARPHPYVRPGFSRSSHRAIDAVRQKLFQIVDKYERKGVIV